MPEKDKFGLPFMHQRKTNGFYWTLEKKPDLRNVLFAGKEEDEVTLNNNGDYSFRFPFNPGDFSLHPNHPEGGPHSNGGPRNHAIDECNMDFNETSNRGYSTFKDDIKDVEIKTLMKVNTLSKGSTLLIQGPTGHHPSGESGCCESCYYGVVLDLTANPAKFHFTKAFTNSDDYPKADFTHPKINFKLEGHDFIGVCYIRYNKKDGVSANHDSVVMELWFNVHPLTDPEDWFMVGTIEDKGGWGTNGTDCNGAKDQILDWGMHQFRFRSGAVWDGDFKFMSVAEITSAASFEDNPGNPNPQDPGQGTTTEITGVFTSMWDINQYRTSSCAGTGTDNFYSVASGLPDNEERELANSASNGGPFRTRIVQVVESATTNNPLKGHKPLEFKPSLKKKNSPGAGVKVFAKIWNTNGGVEYTSPTQLDPTTLTTSFGKYSFDFSTNTHVLVSGDKIGIEYLGTDANNCIIGEFAINAVTNSHYEQYEKSPQVYDIFTSRDLVADILD